MVMIPVTVSKVAAALTGCFNCKTLKKEFKTKGVHEKSPQEADVGWVCVSFPVASDKVHDMTCLHLASYTIIENKWLLGVITVGGRDDSIWCRRTYTYCLSFIN